MSPSRAAREMSALELRREFDLAFSRPAAIEREAHEDLIVLSIADARYAVRVGEIAAIVRTPRVACVPSRSTALRGVIALRGELLPVFDLAELVGHRAEPEIGRWSLLAGQGERAALAFHHLDRFERVASTALSRPEAKSAGSGFSEDVVRLGRDVLPIINLSQVLVSLAAAEPRADRGREFA